MKLNPISQLESGAFLLMPIRYYKDLSNWFEALFGIGTSMHYWTMALVSEKYPG